MKRHSPNCGCNQIPRRTFLADVGMGFTGLVLGSMLRRDGIARASEASAPAYRLPDGNPHFAPKAKSVIWFFMIGGTSQVESWDPKIALNKYAGKSIEQTPYKDVLTNKFNSENLRLVVRDDANGQMRHALYPMQTGFRKRGQSGIEVSDWWPHVGNVIDDIAVVRSMWTTDSNHGSQMQFHTGRHVLDGQFPTIGSWVHYGLGSLNDNLPQFVVLGSPLADCCGGAASYGAFYLGPQHSGIRLNVDPVAPLPFAAPAGKDVFREEQDAEFELLHRLNNHAAIQYPEDDSMRARIKSYELAFRMQASIPETLKFDEESPHIQELYGINTEPTQTFGRQCLAARRLVERGVRFVQIFHGDNQGAGAWDAHSGLKTNHTRLCAEVDQPIGALITDLKQRGLLDETLVVWATEFGRTPGSQAGDGRDHHPYGFSIWMAGGGIKGGVVHGATDEIGFHAVEDRHYVTDVHATILHQLGLDPRKLSIPGRKRLEIDYGTPIHQIIA